MRHPARKRNISLIILLGCIAGAIVGNTLLLPYVQGGPQAMMNVGLLTVGIFALVFWGIYVSAASGYRKLMAGEKLLAQWMVSPEIWKEWLAYHAKLAPLNPIYHNQLDLTKNPPPEGVEVVLGEQSMVVDGDFNWLPAGDTTQQYDSLEILNGPPLFMNMHITTTTHSKHGVRKTQHALRFPIAPEAVEDANAALHWYIHRANEMARQRRSLLDKYPAATRNISLGIAILSGLACFIGFYCRNQPQLLDQHWAVGFAVTGVLVTPVALFMAWMAHGALKAKRQHDKQLAESHASQQSAPHSTTPPPTA